LCASRGGEADIAFTLIAYLGSRDPAFAGTARKILARDLVQNRTARDGFDFASVAIHELGHALGLAHDTSDRESVMWFEGLSVGRVNRALSASDKRHLRESLQSRYAMDIDIPETTDREVVGPSR
jgi:hypothetical protein